MRSRAAQVGYDRPTHPLYRGVLCRYIQVLPVLGIPTRFETNSRHVLRVVRAAFGIWGTLSRPVPTRRPALVRIVVHDFDGYAAGRLGPSLMVYRVPDLEREVLIGAGSAGVADARRREALAYVTPRLVADEERFRRDVVEGLTFGLLAAMDRCPLHAGGIARGPVGLLLAGETGAGKSTLVYAAAAAGWDALAEDTVFLQRRPRFRVWGNPGIVHLAPEVRRHFARLSRRRPVLLANGKRKLVVALPGRAARRLVVERAGVCVLQRGTGAVTMTPLGPADTYRRLMSGTSGGHALFRGRAREPLRRLCRLGGWQLTLSPNPTEALPYLEAMLADVARRPR